MASVPVVECRRAALMHAAMVLAAVVGLAATALAATALADTSTNRAPHIVVVLADDLGYGDLACYGHPRIQTPHLDRFAAESLRLTNCYAAAANCSPSRAGLLTGRTPYRAGIHNWIPMFSPMHLRREEVTVASLLRRHGYTTCHVGKWHLNGQFNLPGQPQPSDHGFDHWYSTQNNALPSHEDPDNFVRIGQPVGPLQGYSAELVATEAIRWLTEQRDQEKPFFLFVCFHEPHEPIATASQYRQLYQADEDSTLPAHHGNVTQMDHAFGRLMQCLERLELRDETFVLFTSDNGPAITARHPHGSAGPLRAKKGHLYEGGIRVPGILRWPGRVPAGGTSDEPVCGVDLLPTLCELADVTVPADLALDGASIRPLFEGQPVPRQTPLYWQFNRAASAPKVAMRVGDWKILAALTGPELPPTGDLRPEDMRHLKSAELGALELYNLADDPGEERDLARQQPQRLRELTAQLTRMYHEVRDESPVWPAWEWPRYEARRIREGEEARRQRAPK